ncbi:hypothetical protein Tco_0119261, partial [Tanacetum coccineum]
SLIRFKHSLEQVYTSVFELDELDEPEDECAIRAKSVGPSSA